MKENSLYKLDVGKRRLYFRTTSYRVERGSMLHSGIYNRELTSSLVAGAVLLAAALAVIFAGVEVRVYHYVLAAVLFTVLFAFFRVFVFFEDYLEMVMDKDRGEVRLLVKRFVSRARTFELGEVGGVAKGYTVFTPQNPDGIQVVEKIALQHGTAIPGFGETKEYHTVNLELKEERDITVFVTEDASEARSVLDVMKNFLGESLAQED
ncbi:MAG: hypothetical protein P8Y66_10430 [Nitrospirota bacterium]|jgi:hypothetical protein